MYLSVDLLNLCLAILEVKIFSSLTLLRYVLKMFSTMSGCTVTKILNEYGVDFIKLDTPHDIKDEMALQYRKTLSDCIKVEEWKIDMITESFDCINGIYEPNLNEEEKMFLLNDLCTL